jgi:hypothetical protein
LFYLSILSYHLFFSFSDIRHLLPRGSPGNSLSQVRNQHSVFHFYFSLFSHSLITFHSLVLATVRQYIIYCHFPLLFVFFFAKPKIASVAFSVPDLSNKPSFGLNQPSFGINTFTQQAKISPQSHTMSNTSDPLVRPCPAPVQGFWSTIASTPSPLAQISQFSTQLQTQQTHYSTQQAQISNVAAPNGRIPWNPADIGFFYPDMPHSWGITEAVVIEEIAYYRTVYAFTNKLRSAAQSRDPKEITQNLYTCFRGEAL